MGPLAITGIASGIGALANLFGHKSNALSEEEIKNIIDSLPKYDDETARINLQRRISSLLKARQTETSQKNSMLGINDPQAVYAYDAPIFDKEEIEQAKIDELKQKDINDKKSYEAQLRLNNLITDKNNPSAINLLTSGAITGANLGTEITGLLRLAKPSVETPTPSIEKPDSQQNLIPLPNTNSIPGTEVLPDTMGTENLSNNGYNFDLNALQTLSKKYGLNYKNLLKLYNLG